MFLQFQQNLRAHKVPAGLGEWLTLMRALQSRAVEPDFTAFYQVARAILCRDENDYKGFDRAFLETFRDLVPEQDILKEILDHMAEGKDPLMPTDELLKKLTEVGFDEVLRQFFEQLREEHYKQHQGGNKAIGKYGTSTQGADGYNKMGVRVGQQHGRHGNAIKIAEWRRFNAYDSSRILDTREIQAALRMLKRALPVGPRDELNLDATIDKTCRNGGEIELVYERREVPTARLVLLLDVGGSMDPFAEAVSLLFSAAKSQLRDLQTYYFHNCVYHEVWQDAARRNPVPTQRIIEQAGKDHWLLVVGDGAMSPYELMHKDGAIDLLYKTDKPGIEWLMALRAGFVRSAWLNPEPLRSWEWTFTIQQIRSIFPMYQLNLEGVREAVDYLRKSQLPLSV